MFSLYRLFFLFQLYLRDTKKEEKKRKTACLIGWHDEIVLFSSLQVLLTWKTKENEKHLTKILLQKKKINKITRTIPVFSFFFSISPTWLSGRPISSQTREKESWARCFHVSCTFFSDLQTLDSCEGLVILSF